MSSRYCANCGDVLSKCNFYGSSNNFLSNSSLMPVFNLGLVVGEMSERMTQLCQRCGFIFNNIYQSKIAFLNKTMGESIIARFAFNTHTFNNTFDLNENQDKMLEKMSCSMSKERDDEPNNENDECIFPLNTSDNLETLVSSVPEGEEFSLNVLEMKELVPKLQIVKLDAEMKTNNSTSLATDSLICSKCGRQFLTTERLSNHEAAAHSQNICPYNCSFCDKTFQLEWFYKHHLKITHKGIQIQLKCYICDDKFYNNKDLQSHKLQKHDIRTYPLNCNHCLESFDVISNLREHLLNEHSRSDEAAAAVSNVKLLEILEKENSTNSLRCPNCQKEFTQATFRKNHIKLEHNGICLCRCGKSLEYSSWINHYKICVKKLQLGIFKCEICAKQILRVSGLKFHYNTHLVQTRPFQYFCTLCSRSYLYQTSYDRHMKYVHSDNNISSVPHKCECGKKFENNNDLADHGKNCNFYVTGSFSCAKCNKKFESSAKFDVHKLWHTKETEALQGKRKNFLPPNFTKFTIPDGTKEVNFNLCYFSQSAQFSCPVNGCRRLYDYKTALRKHLKKTHDIRGFTKSLGRQAPVKIRTIKCSDCPRLFAGHDALQEHYRRYHRTIEHHIICLVCDKQYDVNHIIHHYNRHSTSVSFVPSSRNKRLETNLKDLNHWYSMETQRYECSINNCVSKFRLKSEFLNHCTTDHGCNISRISVAMPKFDFICTRHDCNKSYPTKVQLREHSKNHKKKKIKPKC